MSGLGTDGSSVSSLSASLLAIKRRLQKLRMFHLANKCKQDVLKRIESVAKKSILYLQENAKHTLFWGGTNHGKMEVPVHLLYGKNLAATSNL